MAFESAPLCVLGHKANQFPPEKITMAMAARGKNVHYRWAKIVPRHWLSTADACGFSGAEGALADLVERTPAVVAGIQQELPEGFPADVSEPILAGLEKAAKRLAAG